MTTDEILRRIELAKMFVKDAIEALEPVITSESIFRSESETIRKLTTHSLTSIVQRETFRSVLARRMRNKRSRKEI